MYGAANAIDLDMSIMSYAKSGNPVWLKLIFVQVQCVKELMWYKGNPSLTRTWTCSQDDCYKCEGHCSKAYLNVYIEGTKPDHNLPPNTDCRYGDVVIRIKGETKQPVCMVN